MGATARRRPKGWAPQNRPWALGRRRHCGAGAGPYGEEAGVIVPNRPSVSLFGPAVK
jgi:hypothetical protein